MKMPRGDTGRFLWEGPIYISRHSDFRKLVGWAVNVIHHGLAYLLIPVLLSSPSWLKACTFGWYLNFSNLPSP